MKIPTDARLPNVSDEPRYLHRLIAHLTDVLRYMAHAINEEKHEGTAAPTTGLWSQGQYVRNSTPSELGSASSKYIIKGWVCTVSGEPGTWVESRTLTGN